MDTCETVTEDFLNGYVFAGGTFDEVFESIRETPTGERLVSRWVMIQGRWLAVLFRTF